jgi:antitoxin VapB
MALHVRDEKTDALVRELARRRGVSITAAVRQAVEDALSREEAGRSLWERTADIRTRIANYPLTGETTDKAFYDALWEE